MNLKTHTKTALLYFVFAAALGCILRFYKVLDIPITYKFIVHAHSHVALLGWVYLGLTTLLYKLYLSKSDIETKYSKIFWFTQVTIIGMLLTFPFQGYALFSIVFSTLFLFASYWFSWFFFKNVPAKYYSTQSLKCAKVAIVYLLISSIGPWALGGIMNTLGAASIWYRMAIYFYLHFIYNGWMIMALVAILFYIFEKQGMLMPESDFKKFFWKLNLGIVLSFLLSTLFTKPTIFYYILGGVGAVLQLWAFYDLLKLMKEHWCSVKNIFSPFYVRIVKVIVLLWAIKMLLQLLSSAPYFADLAILYLDFTIGYLHLTFLGVVTISLFLFLDYFQLLILNKKLYLVYIFGFILTEVLIFYKGITSWQSITLFTSYYLVLAVASLLILVAVLSMLINSNKGKLKN
ncbi:hypothetical protein [Maribacter hydrothermalis]|uniref:Uncharacterized protein n=1 Tax=Maribacter hydrothermalis TaxID=1836467 RepID=A0A1B7YZ49_9FLAO|nr:hypothetical protein [Maribacter hydrothermalis]APQ16060.1 hypothetical protein BTR34_01300 [Maribacter hydrothermalis]OBR35762.1 hypothetical protein A9200_11210 [Maribacter hydrothermalis]